MSDPETQVIILRSQVKAMIVALEQRVGTTDYSTMEIDKLAPDELSAVRRALHELLYSPPPRNS